VESTLRIQAGPSVNDEQRAERLVSPFYLRMMRSNAVRQPEELLTGIAARGAELSSGEVIALLRSPWRERVMGGWFAVLSDDPDVTTAVLASLATSLGYLTSPALAAVAVTLAGPEASSALLAYAANDVENNWGACGEVAAALEHIGVVTEICQASDDDRATFIGLLDVASRLRAMGRK
jgi:hypothetical protein